MTITPWPSLSAALLLALLIAALYLARHTAHQAIHAATHALARGFRRGTAKSYSQPVATRKSAWSSASLRASPTRRAKIWRATPTCTAA
jgi:hypothetical protein